MTPSTTQESIAATGARNLADLWDMREVLDMEHLDAYHRYRANIGILAKHYGFSRRRCIAAFAVLSPNNSEMVTYRALEAACVMSSWDVTKRYTVTIPAYGRNQKKALSILSGAVIKSQLRGIKVTSFYHNILRPNDPTYVTVDGHMFNAWRGERLRLADTRLRVTVPVYNQIADDIRALAARVGHAAPAVQAVLWFVWKRINNILYNPQFQLPYTFRPLSINKLINRKERE